MVLFALPLTVLGAGGLVVDTASPDALCPPLEPTRAVVAARLGDVELEGVWRATYVVVHRNEGDFVNLTLRDPGGVSRLERQFPVQGGCATLSQVIALVLERFFLRPGTEVRDETALEPVPLDASKPTAEKATDQPAQPIQSAPVVRTSGSDAAKAQPSQPAAIEKQPSSSAPHAAHAWSVDAGLWMTNAWLAPSAQVTRDWWPYAVSLGAGVDLQDHEAPVDGGWVRTRRFPIFLSGIARFGRDAQVSPFLGVEVMGLVERAWTEGLPETGAGTRVVAGLGLRLGADFLRGSVAGPFAELTAALLLAPASSAFQVDQQPVAVPPTLVLGGRFGIRLPF